MRGTRQAQPTACAQEGSCLSRGTRESQYNKKRTTGICQSPTKRARPLRWALLTPKHSSLGVMKRLAACGSNFPLKERFSLFLNSWGKADDAQGGDSGLPSELTEQPFNRSKSLKVVSKGLNQRNSYPPQPPCSCTTRPDPWIMRRLSLTPGKHPVLVTIPAVNVRNSLCPTAQQT